MFLDSIAVVILILVIVFPFLLAWYISSILRKNRDLDRVRQDRVTTRIEKLARQTTEAIDSIRNSQIALNANLDNAAKIILHHSRFIDSQIKKLNELGYNVKPHIIDFSKYGVPQRRKRFILVGSLNGKANDFEPTIDKLKPIYLSEKGIRDTTTIGDAISDLLCSNGTTNTPDRKNFKSGVYGKSNSNFQNLMRGKYVQNDIIPDSHSFAHHSEETVKVFSSLIEHYPIKGKRIENKERERWNIKKRGITVLDSKQVSPTLTTHPDDYIHYSEPRILTVREYARIQTFPDWYEIKKKYTTGGQMRKVEVPRYTQIGNAIPPLFAELAGLALKEML